MFIKMLLLEALFQPNSVFLVPGACIPIPILIAGRRSPYTFGI